MASSEGDVDTNVESDGIVSDAGLQGHPENYEEDFVCSGTSELVMKPVLANTGEDENENISPPSTMDVELKDTEQPELGAGEGVHNEKLGDASSAISEFLKKLRLDEKSEQRSNILSSSQPESEIIEGEIAIKEEAQIKSNSDEEVQTKQGSENDAQNIMSDANKENIQEKGQQLESSKDGGDADVEVKNEASENAEEKSCFTVHPLLEDYQECFFNWVSNEEPLTAAEAETIASVIFCKLENITGPLVLKQLRMAPVETIAQRLCVAFCQLVQSKISEAQEELKEAAVIIKQAAGNKFISEDYAEGLVYLFTGLEAFKMSLSIKSADEDDKALCGLKEYLEQSTNYASLPQKSRCAITGVLTFFAGNRRQNLKEHQILKELVQVDPDVEWLINLHAVQRICRREKDHRAGPDEEEKMTILQAVEIAPNHVMVKLHVCMYLSDVLRAKTWDPMIGSLVLGNHAEFSSIKEVVAHIKMICNEILMQIDHSLKINITIAEFFSTALPFEFRDPQLAKKCLGNAVLMNPKSSKANHKMGLFILITEKKPQEALKFVKKAFEDDRRNFSALIDTIQILLSNPKDNSKELQTIFKEFGKNNGTVKWSDSRLSSLLFMKGAFHYMMRNKENALWTWIEGYKIGPSSAKSFQQIQYYTTRYWWSRKDISIVDIWKYITDVHDGVVKLNRKPDLEELKLISVLKDVIESAKSENDIRQSRYNSGGRGGGRYGGAGDSHVTRQQGGGGDDHGSYRNGYSRGRGTGIFRGRNNDGNWRSDTGLNQKQEPVSSSHDQLAGPSRDMTKLPRHKKQFVDKPQLNGAVGKVRDPTAPGPDSGRGFQANRGRGRGGFSRGRGGTRGAPRGGKSANTNDGE